MITSSVHALAPDLSQSLTQLGSALESRMTNVARSSPASQIEPVPETPRETNWERIADHQAIKRDAARQAAVFAVQLQTEKSQAEALLETIPSPNDSTDGDDTSSGLEPLDPAKVYDASMTYHRRMDLVAALEKASLPESERPRINILV